MDQTDLLRRARGALLGVAIGDAMGAPVEGRTAAEIAAEYGRITGFLTAGGGGTDDTDFTLFNAHLLITYGVEITLAQVEEAWRTALLSGQWHYRPGGFSDVISTRNLAGGLHAPASGAFNHQMWSDGVAMAISAAGIAAAGDPPLAARLAEVLGSVSNGRDGIYAAQAVAAAVAAGAVGAAPGAMLAAALTVGPPDSWTRRALLHVQRLSAEFGGDEAHNLARVSEELTVAWWPWADLVTEAVPLAFGAFLACGGELRRAIPAGVSLGRDADTIGAIVGSLSGVHCGADAIPPEWAARVQVAPGKCIGFVGGMNIDSTAEQLVRMGLARAGIHG